MKANTTNVLSVLSLVLGAGLYLAGVAGLFGKAVAPGDVGLVATSAIFILFGALGLLLGRTTAPSA